MNKTAHKLVPVLAPPKGFRAAPQLDESSFIESRLRSKIQGQYSHECLDKMGERLKTQIASRSIQGEQWYKNFADWMLISVNNPVHYRHPNSELVLLSEKRGELAPLVENRLQVHYGVGVGETELELVRWQLDSAKRAEIVAVDANLTFIELFLKNLRSRAIESPLSEILFKGYNDLFQYVGRADLHFENSAYDGRLLVCLGGTIGNFMPQGEIFKIFSDNTLLRDRVLLGFHMNAHIEEAFEKYRNHPHYPDFVLNWMKEIDRSKISWKMDKESGYITMHYDGIGEVFRTRRYDFSRLAGEIGEFGFTVKGAWTDEYNDACIAVFERTSVGK